MRAPVFFTDGWGPAWNARLCKAVRALPYSGPTPFYVPRLPSSPHTCQRAAYWAGCRCRRRPRQPAQIAPSRTFSADGSHGATCSGAAIGGPNRFCGRRGRPQVRFCGRRGRPQLSFGGPFPLHPCALQIGRAAVAAGGPVCPPKLHSNAP